MQFNVITYLIAFSGCKSYDNHLYKSHLRLMLNLPRKSWMAAFRKL